jgi:iron complex transport system ATP-binding protein
MKSLLETHELAIGYPVRRGRHRVVAEGIDLHLRAGELVCLLGPNGAGKSTLLRTLAGMQRPLSGQVRLLGTDLYDLDPRDLARRLSVVLTERVDVGALSARAVVAMGRYPHTGWTGRLAPDDDAVVTQALASVGAMPLAARLVQELSDGERQKVLIARALAQEPHLLLLDEPTAFLDLPRRVEMMSLLHRLARETRRAILLSTHDLDLALRSADQLWLLPPGGPLRAGIPEELVLEGAFQATFPSEEVCFDPYSGHFKLQVPARGHVDLIGKGLAALWTGRALEREGFIVNDQAGHQAPVRVEVQDQSGSQRWYVHHAETCHEYPALIQTLSGVKDCLWHLHRESKANAE